MPFLSLGGLTGRLITLGLVHGFWIGLLAASAAAIALRFVPHRRREAQYGLLLAALGVAALGPPVATALQRSRAGSLWAFPATALAGTVVVIPGPVAHEPDEATPAADPGPLAAPRPSPLLARFDPIATRVAAAFDALQPIVLAAWLLAALPLLALVAIGLLATGVRRREARPAPAAIQERCDRLARRIGLRRAPPVLVHPDLEEPCLCGLVRPAILLPGRWLPGAGAERIDAVLAHELAHDRRLDLPVNLAQRLIEAVFFFHPAILWLSRSLRDRRERIADAMAASLTGDPIALARALESVARLRPSSRRMLPMSAPLGGEDPSLLSRVKEILGMTPARPPARVWPLAALPAAALVALLSTSLGLAEDRPTPPSGDGPPTGPGVLSVTAGDQALGVNPAGGPNTPRDLNRQICYEIRFVEAGASLLRDRFRDRLRPVGGEDSQPAWLLDRKEHYELLTVVQGDVAATVTQAPKVTAFEGDHATIADTHKMSFVADARPVLEPDSVSWKPEIKAITLGSTVDVSGTMRPGETDLNVDLHDTALIAVHALTREAESSRGKSRATYQVPTTTEQRLRRSCRVPEGSTLMVSLGVVERPGRLTGVAQVAVALLEAAGTPLRARGKPTERFVLITPRHIILEEEEERLSIPAFEVPSFRPGGR